MDYDGDEAVFNIGGGSRITLNTALDVMGSVLTEKMEVSYKGAVKGDVSHTYADIRLAQGELGYSPKADLEEGLAREAEWVRAIHKKLKAY